MINHPKYKNLISYLKDLGSVVVAYSGGVDSTFLLAAAKEALENKIVNCYKVNNTKFSSLERSLPERLIRSVGRGVPDRREGEVVEFVCSFCCVSYN